MRIGEPAYKHGVPEEDTWHAVRNALRKVTMDDDLTMLAIEFQGAPLSEEAPGVIETATGEEPWHSRR